MYNQEFVKGKANDLHTEMAKRCQELVESTKGSVTELLGSTDYERCHLIASKFISSVKNYMVLASADVEGVGLPKYIINFRSTKNNQTGGMESFTLTVKSGLKARVAYSTSATIVPSEDFVKELFNVVAEAIIQLFYINYAVENVNVLNKVIADAAEEVNAPILLSFEVITTAEVIVSATDNHVVLAIGADKALTISGLDLLANPSEEETYQQFIKEESLENLKKFLLSVQTPAQMIKSKYNLTKNLVDGITSKRRADKLLRQTYKKNARYIHSIKAGVCYFEETVKIEGEDVDVFAIVEKSAEGITVLLSPFDKKTLLTVEYDVVADIQGFIADAKDLGKAIR